MVGDNYLKYNYHLYLWYNYFSVNIHKLFLNNVFNIILTRYNIYIHPSTLFFLANIFLSKTLDFIYSNI